MMSTRSSAIPLVRAISLVKEQQTNIGRVDHVAVAFYVDGFACVNDVFWHIGFVVEVSRYFS